MKLSSQKLASSALYCALAWTISCGGAFAQGATAAQPGATIHASAPEKGQAVFDQYLVQSRGSAPGAAALEEVFVNGIPKTAKNSGALRSLLASKVTAEEKLMVTRLLAKQYARNDPTGMNHLILLDLKTLSASQDVPLARAATLAFSRLGFFADHQDVLLSAKDRGVIEEDTYYGELAHVFAFAPAADQERLAKVLRASRNYYASQIVAMVVNNAPVAKNIAPRSRPEFVSYLEDLEPSFSMALGQFDFVEAIRYSAWLRALANLKASDSNKQGAEVIMAKLDDGSVDPRKVMAFLVSEFGPELMTKIGQKARFDSMLQRIALYAKQHPQNTDMKDIVDQVKAAVATLG
jgi:hypothetical protein